MELELEQIENVIKKKLKTNQLLLAMSILMSLTVFLTNTDYVFWAIAFISIGALSLPNITKSKKDLIDYKNYKYSMTEGILIDMFPEKKDVENGNWIIFIHEENKKKDYTEFVVMQNPNIAINSKIKIQHTKELSIPIKIEVIELDKETLIEEN
ncbi:MAG: hypothetical protein K0R54_631 [Clostridiaceae bacterium]|jgi:outer membrane receptor for ferrienterochelin and colicin|nr:hypothetical protein [Clostridiaceae bacterium]